LVLYSRPSDVHRGFGGVRLQRVASCGHVDIDDSTNLDQHNNCIHWL
jgi:hypothetical protein